MKETIAEQNKFLILLQLTVPADTVLTVSAAVQILELLGIVANPELVKTMQLSLTLVPASTPATLNGVLQLIAGLIKLSPKTTASHAESIDAHLATLATVTDTVLTYGTFLPICESLLKQSRSKSGKT